MTEMFKQEELNKTFKEVEEGTLDQHALMAAFVKYNQAVEECTKLVSSDSPYITNFYMSHGFRNIFSLYHFLRKITPEFKKMDDLRIIFSKHLQLLWSNLGDFFASVIECKFIHEAREVYPIVTEKHKTESEFVSSLYYHICSEIFKQEDIITFYLEHSKFFLECLIDIMKLLINEDEQFKNPAPRDNRANRFGDRFGARGIFGEAPRPPQQNIEYDDDTINNLTQLGFTRRRVIEALNRTQGNVDASAEYLFNLPPEIVQSDQIEEEEEAKKESTPKKDAKMEESDSKEDDKMEVEDDGIHVKTADELTDAIKVWLEVLYNWVLKGFNSALTDVDVENITLFILRYISKEEDVTHLMNALLESLKEMFNQFKDPKTDKSTNGFPLSLKACMKKAVTLSKIISHLNKKYLKNLDFIKNLMTFLQEFFSHFKESPINFNLFYQDSAELKDITENEIQKIEEDNNKDILSASQTSNSSKKDELVDLPIIIDNCLNILIASYGFYKLSTIDEIVVHLENKEDKSKEEEEKKQSKEEFESTDKKEEKLIENYFQDLGALEDVKSDDKDFNASKELNSLLKEWSQALSDEKFLDIGFLMIDHADHSFDE